MNDNGRRAIQRQLDRVAYLRATGPNPFDYWVWADQTEALLAQIFGDLAPETTSFREAVSERGRTPDQRGLLGDMTLGLHGAWGIRARLERGQRVLDGLGTAVSQG